jgi:glycosyltransferase involved in cell wall biosynthesis
MRILFTSGRELSYPRNELLIHLLEQSHKVDVVGKKSGKASITLFSLVNTFQVFIKNIKKPYDLIVVGFLGQLIALIVSLFYKKVILDVFVSIYDTLCLDRELVNPKSLLAKILKWIDYRACMNVKHVIVDTKAHMDFFSEVINIPAYKMSVLFVGCNDQIFHPVQLPSHNNLVLFYGSLLPLHGLEVILQAARFVQDENLDIHFKIIGITPQNKYISSKTLDLNLTNTIFSPPVSITALRTEIAVSKLCLCGHFGNTPKARRVIAGKTYQCIAMGKPVIVGENQANQELLTHNVDSWFCEMNNSKALADAIIYLMKNDLLLNRLGENGRKTYLQKASNKILEQKLNNIIYRIT